MKTTLNTTQPVNGPVTTPYDKVWSYLCYAAMFGCFAVANFLLGRAYYQNQIVYSSIQGFYAGQCLVLAAWIAWAPFSLPTRLCSGFLIAGIGYALPWIGFRYSNSWEFSSNATYDSLMPLCVYAPQFVTAIIALPLLATRWFLGWRLVPNIATNKVWEGRFTIAQIMATITMLAIWLGLFVAMTAKLTPKFLFVNAFGLFTLKLLVPAVLVIMSTYRGLLGEMVNWRLILASIPCVIAGLFCVNWVVGIPINAPFQLPSVVCVMATYAVVLASALVYRLYGIRLSSRAETRADKPISVVGPASSES